MKFLLDYLCFVPQEVMAKPEVRVIKYVFASFALRLAYTDFCWNNYPI